MPVSKSPSLDIGNRELNVLLIDDDPDVPSIISGFLEEKSSVFQLKWVATLADGLSFLETQKADVVLLDLHLPDSKGLDTFTHVRSQYPTVPIVVMTSLDDERCALEAVQKGAQDYLVKGEVDGKRLGQILCYAVVRHKTAKDSSSHVMIDDLTGLHNRRGFMTLAHQQLKSVHRAGTRFVVFLSYLHNLKKIQEEFGEDEANHAIVTASQILKENFRASDIVARVGVDRFVVIPSNHSHYYPKAITRRIDKNPKYYNAQFNCYKLSLSVGSLQIHPDQIQSEQHIMDRIDKVFDFYSTRRQEKIPT